MKNKSVKKTRKERVFFAIYVALLALCLVFAEVLLRFTGFGIDTRPFRKVNIDGVTYYRDNTYFINKYYPASSIKIKTEEKNLFLAKKNPGSLRGFVLGGSTAQGYPYNSNQSFSAFLQRSLNDGFNRLQNNAANSLQINVANRLQVEIVNMGYSAMSSYYVADAAKKILKYEPDFLLIYSGHNEYYGTIGAMSGKSHKSRKIYLTLKEFRLFQLFDKLINFRKVSSGANTLMDKQFAGAAYAQDEKKDADAARNFIDNINEVATLYGKKNIPVIIFEPVSNLFDMPPFAGKDDERFRELIEKSLAALENDDEKETEQCRKLAKNYQDNANLAYLEAVYQVREGRDSYFQLVKAKDGDVIPFRTRSRLTSELEKYCSASNNRSLFYIPTSKLMRDEGILPDNDFFSDHLHFSIEGNRWIAFQAAIVLRELFGLDRDKTFEIFKTDRENFYKQFPLSELDRYRVARSISLLVENEPFKSMKIPYYPKFPVDNRNVVVQDAAFVRIVRDCIHEDFYLNACDYFLQTGKYIQAREAALSFVKCFPANAEAHNFLSLSLAALGIDEEAQREKNFALSLSGKLY